MTDYPPVSEAVRRVLARDDLLMMAADADKAVGIVRQREALARRTEDEKSLFSLALDHYLRIAENPREQWALRAQAWKHAGVIVRFGQLVGIEVEMPEGKDYTATELHANSLSELEDKDAAGIPGAEPLDLTLHEFHRYPAARDLRLAGRPEDALGLSSVTSGAVHGSGADPHLAHLMYEVGAAYISRGQAGQVEGALHEMDAYFRTTRAAGHSTRYRFDFIRALAHWETDGASTDKGAAARGLMDAQRRASLGHRTRRSTAGTGADVDGVRPERGIELLSVILTRAEYLAARNATGRDRAEALKLGREALRLADDVRGRWRVIARSRAPLAVVFQRIYGDIALLAAKLHSPAAAELGLRVALSAKQTGFAARMRTGRQLLNRQVRSIIDDIIHRETVERTDIGNDEKLKRLRFELQEAVSPMLADTVLPLPADLSKLTEVIGDRYALDYLELTDSLGETPNLFRALLRPGGRLSFEVFEPPAYYARFFARARHSQNLAAMLGFALRPRDLRRQSVLNAEDRRAVGDPNQFDWRVLAESILPEELRADLAAASSDRPVELIISAHSWLSLVPWPALDIAAVADQRIRLVERAIVTQTPAFTCLHRKQTPPVTGRALIRLVGKDDDGVDIGDERVSWGLTAHTASVRLSGCAIASKEAPTLLAGTLAEAMAKEGRWGFVHIAAHGEGEGLTQRLAIPEEPLSFGSALVLKWPASVVMASCHVGRVINVTEAEPLNLVMALLSGGAKCVVAGITSIDDRGTGKAASHIVGAIRAENGPVSLDVALRDAQLAAVQKKAPEQEWALLGAYVQ